MMHRLNIDWSGPRPEGNGVTINVPSRDILLADLDVRMKEGRGYSIATLNLDHITKLRGQPAFEKAYLAHTHVTADGNPIVWLSRLAGHDVALLPGSELIDPVAALAERNKIAVALLGSTQESLQAAATALVARYPDLDVCAKIAPPMGFDPVGKGGDSAINALRESDAGLCFLALGAPKQEIFAARAQTALSQMGFLSIGAGLDFISGRQVRAPRIVRRLAGEWLWRLSQDPRRLAGRYGECLMILPSLFYDAQRQRMHRKTKR
jgi:N-acetylglucosaminyldiphosphoundecaprenol N-acetyl-beta-D-mannosaminyltransferase